MPQGVETRRVEIQCTVCQIVKDRTEFYCKDRLTGRLDAACKACRIIKTRESVLGVTQQDYIELHKRQGGHCGICRKPLRSRRYKAFAVDHDHVTGRIRGLLCTGCNTGLGLFRDCAETLHRAIEWIKV